MRLIDDPATTRFGLALIYFLWQGTVIALLAALGSSLLRHASAQARYMVLLFALALMVLCPAATFVLTDGRLPAASATGTPATAPVVADASEEMSHAIGTGQLALGTPSAIDKPTSLRSMSVSGPSRLRSYLSWVTLAWVLGVALLSLRLLARWAALDRMRQCSVDLKTESWSCMLMTACARLSVTRPVRLMESAAAHAPSVIGWLRPVILLPASALTGLTPEQWEAILAHELAHIRRHDYLVNLAQTVAETLLFYHPAVWWVSGCIRAEREHCCDDLVVATGSDRVTYAKALASLEQTRDSLALAASRGPLLVRIQRLIGPDQRKNSPLSTRLAGLVALGIVFAITIGLQTFGLAAPRGVYDRFLFVRHDIAPVKRGGTDVLVMATVASKGIRTRDLLSRNNLSIGLELLGVYGGRIYFLKIGQLYQLDLATGRRSAVSGQIRLHDFVNGKLFALENRNVICEFDLSKGLYRTVANLPRETFITRMEASPNGKQLAFFTQVHSSKRGFADQLYVVDTATGTQRAVATPIRFNQTLAVGPPFEWLNNRDILFMKTEGQTRWDASTGHLDLLGRQTDHLFVIDVERSITREVCPLPGTSSVRWIELESPNEPAHPIVRTAEEIYAIDVAAGRLVKQRTIGESTWVAPGGPQPERFNKLLPKNGESLHAAAVSPDGKRLIWISGVPQTLYYYDSTTRKTRKVGNAWSSEGNAGLLWIPSTNLKHTRTGIRKGWQQMKATAPAVPGIINAGPKQMR